jgi:outer membrane lipoprotein
MRQVDEIRPFSEIQKSPETYVKKTVLWGGVIIETTNKQNETLIKVLQTELDAEKRPENLDISSGRFLVHYPGFLDLVIYAKGREITVVGEIVGKEVFKVGEIQYIYPVVLSKEIHLWEKRSEYMYGYPPYWDYNPYWWYRHPYWRYPYPGR